VSKSRFTGQLVDWGLVGMKYLLANLKQAHALFIFFYEKENEPKETAQLATPHFLFNH